MKIRRNLPWLSCVLALAMIGLPGVFAPQGTMVPPTLAIPETSTPPPTRRPLPPVRTEIVHKIQTIPAHWITINDSSLPIGIRQVERTPQDGQREIIWRYIYRGKKLISTRQVSSRLIQVPINGIRRIGTKPKTKPHPKPTTTNTLHSSPSDGSINISADFLKVSGSIRTAGNITLGAPFDSRSSWPLVSSPEFRSALATLAPRFVRLDAGTLVDLTDSSRPSFSFRRLLSSVRRAKSLKAEVLIALPVPPEWGLDAVGYSIFCRGVAQALAPVGTRYFELDSFSAGSHPKNALSFYNAGYNALKTFNSKYAVGGFGASADNSTAHSVLLSGARGLDFLAVSVSGAATNDDTDSYVLGKARDISFLKIAAALLDRSRFKRAALFVTKANFSLQVHAGEAEPSDERLLSPVAGAWWGVFLASGSRLSDQIFHADGGNASGGLLDNVAKAYPAYYSIWLWNTYFPPGSQRVATSSSNSAVFVTAANTSSSHNVLLVNTTEQAQTAKVSILGFPVLRQARLRIFDDPKSSVRFQDLPKSPSQTIKLAPYAVAVVQFIEAPQHR